MIALDKLTDEQFERHALDVLKREWDLTAWRGSYA